jgi:eukaryotic-like serine/threonine-protein kinase
MSPEQARGDLEHLGPRSDVYSLGATLYCLLTGRPPFEGDDLGAVLRAVQRGEFAPPRQVIPKTDQALEGICKKAMSLLPEDRYATPRALAEDTERWMADEPVTAWREPRVTRIARWARRHRPLVAGAAALLFAAVVALSLGTVLINRERARAEANFQQARSAVDEYFTKVSESKLLDVPGLQPLRKELLESARKYYEGFLVQRGHDSNVRAEAAATYYRLALLTQLIGSPEAAVALYRKAIELYEELARAKPGLARFQSDLAICCNDLGNLYRISGRSADALATIQKSLAIREPLARAHSGLARYQNELAKSFGNLAAVHGEAGRPMDALDSCRRAREINARLVNDLDPDLRFPSDLGRRYNVPSTFRLDMVRDLLATSYAEYGLGRLEESLRTREEASHLAEALAREHPADPEMQELQATCYCDIGIVLSEIGRPTDAIRILDQARSILERLVADSSTVVRYQKHLAATENNIGGVLIMIGRSGEGMASFERARAILTRLAADNPSITWFRYLLAESHRQAGYELDRAGRTADGLGRYEQARAILERLVTDDPAVVDFRFLLASTHAEIGASLARSGRVALALASYESARIGQEALAAESPSLTSFQDQLVQIYNHIGRLMKDTGHPADAERSYRRAEVIQNKLASEHPSVYVYQSTLAYTCRGLARVSVQLGQEDEALRWLEKAAALDLRHADVFPLARFNLACDLALGVPLSGQADGRGRPEVEVRRRERADRAMDALRRAVAQGYPTGLIAQDSDLDALHPRLDYQALMLDLRFPSDPFAHVK